jgi:hypothetical protein
MLDVMVLSVLSLNIGRDSSSFLLPVYQWSSVIEQGIEKEKDYREKIAQLERDKALAEERARQAGELAGQHKELQETTIEQLEKLSEREQQAYQRMLEAEETARNAELQAKLAEEQKQQALEAAQRAAAEKEAAQALAEQAERQAQEASVQAQLAREREAEIKQRISQMEQKQQELAAQQRDAEQQAGEVKGELQHKAGELAAVIQAQQEALKREQEAMQKLQAERERAEQLLVEARLARQEAEQAEQRSQASQKFISHLRDRIVDLKLEEQQARLTLETVQEDKEELSQKLTEIEEARNQSVWVQRDRAMVECSITIVERDQAAGEIQTYQEEVYLPTVAYGDGIYIITDAEHLGLLWWQIQYDRDVVSLAYRVSSLSTAAPPVRLVGPVLSPDSTPAVCMTAVESPAGTAPLQPAGMDMIKTERIQRALAFSPVMPDKSVHVEITPMLKQPYLTVKTLKNKSWFSRREVSEGDYLLTESGHFIGIMVSRELCYVPPTGFPSGEKVSRVPLAPDAPDGTRYDQFVDSARELRQRIKKTPLPRR